MGFKDLVAGAMNWHKTINDNNAEAETRIGGLERNLGSQNILINGYFDVWQRGDNERPDMFQIVYDGGAEGNVQRINAGTKDNCLSWRITKGGTSSYLRYKFSKDEYCKFQNKWYAITVDAEATGECPCTMASYYLGDAEWQNNTFTINNERKKHTVYFRLEDITNGQEIGFVQLIRLNASSGFTGTIKVYSFEMIEVDSPNADLIPKVIKASYSEELRRCQYYFERIYNSNTMYIAPAAIMAGDGKDVLAIFRVAPKRINPSINISGIGALVFRPGANVPAPISSILYTAGFDTGNIELGLRIDNTFAIGTYGMLRMNSGAVYIDISAEL